MFVKKIAGLFLLIIYFAFIPAVQADKAVVTSDNLNIRSGPGTEYNLIGQVNTGTALHMVSVEDGWVEITYDNRTAWVSSDYVDIHSNLDRDSANSQPVGGNDIENIMIQHDNTHLRKGPSTSYDIVGFANKGEAFNVAGEEGNWYKIANEELSGFILKTFAAVHTKPTTSALEDKTIVIDAGHGGRDVGAIGASGTYEKNVTWRTAQELKKELTMLGAEVVLTRKADQFISLVSRTSLANIAGTDAFISIHYNSFPQAPEVTGIGTYYYHKQSEKLAQSIQESLINQTGANNRKALRKDYHVIRQSLNPSILVELGFISNSEKEELLETNSYQKLLVHGIVSGLTKYFKQITF
ncbi:N-acetylmuramoyl-L-alanine amidase [Lentibacillus kapialis]|uniref:N-acetylmuramoyl-L-alanine amidase n=1 Tax=Lentibacillus kapialis TaxID=340214 RepID=A0A917UTH5_9BACI|nr:N-acetylmuramoyl-L-alanine amidase [Lentibacillus kapialis]GGJ83927.1 N-acetylmuramoyl-L-alanine amidase [Lentibacillus kapialis]